MIKINRFPRKVPDSRLKFPPLKMRYAAPEKPRTMPINLFFEILSCKIKWEKISTRIGVPTIIMDALIGVVKFNPSKNMTWLRAMPKNAQMAILIISTLSIRCLGYIDATSQKIIVAPTILSNIIIRGCIKSGIMPLATT